MSRAGARLVLQAISLENPEAFAAAEAAAKANPWGLLEDPEGSILYYSR